MLIDPELFTQGSVRIDDLSRMCAAYRIPCHIHIQPKDTDMLAITDIAAFAHGTPPAANVNDFDSACRVLAMALPNVELIGDCPDAASIGDWIGLNRSDYVALDARVAGRATTLLCVPSRSWHCGETMEMLTSLRELLAVVDRRVVLVPESFIRRQPRLSNAALIAGSSHAGITASDRMRILAVLIEEDSATVLELASLVHSCDPVSSILRLVCEGSLQIDLERPILPTSLVRIGHGVATR